MTDTMLALECCDCGSACRIGLTLLTSDGRIVELAACARCADGVTLKCYKSIPARVFAEAAARGLPVIDYGKRK